ncbi:unnamed protein product [Lactuca virosa]|uniref:Transposase MuDR plant domain-containing protein n=1 Tax=Lactuca virosa TaxID=75947 RepID=A0AAU9P2Y6_9ASTR|nr:unnamed protein product [Lactuca virosa]
MEKSKITDLEQQRSKKDGGSVREDKVSGGGRFGRKKEMERWKHRTRIALENRRRTHDDEVSEEEEFRTVEVKKENIESPIEIHSSKSMKKPIDISSSNSWKKKKARNNVYEYVYSSMKKRKHGLFGQLNSKSSDREGTVSVEIDHQQKSSLSRYHQLTRFDSHWSITFNCNKVFDHQKSNSVSFIIFHNLQLAPSGLENEMEKTVLTPGLILYMSAIFVLISPGGVANFSMSDEFQLFITSVVISQCISQIVKFVGISEEDERKAFIVAFSFEVIGIHQMCLMGMLDSINLITFIINFLMRFILHCWGIGMLGFLGYQMGVTLINEKRFWVRFILISWSIFIMGFIYASVYIVMNSIIDMIDNDDFSIISQAAVITNMMNINNENELHENLEDEIGEENDEEAPFDNNVEVPSTFTNMEGTNLNIDDNWIVSQSTSKNDFIRELGKDSFKDKEELVRAIKIHCIRTHRQFEVIDSRPTILTLRCKLYLQSGCKWKLHASKRKRSGYFEITTYTGPHTCLHYKLSQDHPNLDASLIAMETRHLIKAQPSISIPALRAEIVETLGYTPSYKKNHVVKDREGICLISDRHGGILKAVNEHGSPWLEPRGFHRYCLRHFINNFYDKFRNSELKALAYRAGSQNQIRKFNSIMEEIGKLNPHARHWLESHPLNRWTLAYDGGRRYGLLTTNLSEIFNSVLRDFQLCATYIL